MTPEEKREQLTQFLRERAAEGERYWKSKQIAEELELSPKEVGIYLSKIQRDDDRDVELEQWGTSRGAATWRVSARDKE